MKMKKLKSLCIATCLLMTCIPSTVFANEEIEAAVFATPRYVEDVRVILDNGSGVGITGQNGGGFFLVANVPYYVKLNTSVWLSPSITTIHNIQVAVVNSAGEVVSTTFYKDYTSNTALEFRVPELGLYHLEVTNYGFDTIIIYEAELY